MNDTEEDERFLTFRRLPLLHVDGGLHSQATRAVALNHCANKMQCVSPPPPAAAKMELHRCPGCGLPVHRTCGFLNSKADDKQDVITCFRCFNKFGRTLEGNTDDYYCPTSEFYVRVHS